MAKLQASVIFFHSAKPSPKFDKNDAKKAVKEYIDYYCGRLIKCDLSGDKVDPIAYDYEFGNGTFARVAGSIK